MTAELSSSKPSPRVRYRLLIVAVAVAAAIVVWIIASLAGAQLEVTSPLIGTLEITLPLVIGTSISIALAAWGVLALLERFTLNARMIWTIVAVAILVISVVSVAFLDTTIGGKVGLGFLHFAVGLPLTVLLRRGARNS
ncbi:DUF6069 family protein [Glaciihabitans sp. UYNi722]|uniref:DUF6069 family protein n=1 Tax=Glaciihabitans sp. UYNi722 TaxID=3156344 RepID=UPI00339B7D21